jgi:hypothetical protein
MNFLFGSIAPLTYLIRKENLLLEYHFVTIFVLPIIEIDRAVFNL